MWEPETAQELKAWWSESVSHPLTFTRVLTHIHIPHTSTVTRTMIIMSLLGGCVQMTPVVWVGFQEEGSHLTDMSEGQKLYHHFTPTAAFSAHASHEKNTWRLLILRAQLLHLQSSLLASNHFASFCPKHPQALSLAILKVCSPVCTLGFSQSTSFTELGVQWQAYHSANKKCRSYKHRGNHPWTATNSL